MATTSFFRWIDALEREEPAYKVILRKQTTAIVNFTVNSNIATRSKIRTLPLNQEAHVDHARLIDQEHPVNKK